jgi:hypothetical protein
MIKKKCLQCRKDFTTYPSLDRVRYCSKSCYWVAKKGTKRPEHIKEQISATMKERGIVPKLVRRGSDCNFWKGGVDRKNKNVRRLIRDSEKYKKWRTAVMKRDDYTCQKCKKRGGRIEVDHYPYAFSTILNTFEGIKTPEDAEKIEFLWDIENGKTLCKECHKKYGNQDHKQTGRTLLDGVSGVSQ